MVVSMRNFTVPNAIRAHRDHVALPAGARRADPFRQSRGDRQSPTSTSPNSAAIPTSGSGEDPAVLGPAE